jgi:hypothetical protein
MKTHSRRNFLLSLAILFFGCSPAFADEVELKFVIRSEDVEAALALSSKAAAEIEKRNIYFIETPGHDLRKNDLILRLRQKAGKKDDSTVKLRGTRASKIDPKRFASTEKDEETKLESDRVLGGKTTLSFSLTVKQSEGDVAKLRNGEKKLAQLFSKTQEKFLAEMAPRVDWQSGRLLGPVPTEKWEFQIPEFPGKLTAELWHLPDCAEKRMLEFSIKTDSANADALATQLDQAMKARKLRQPKDPESKTKVVIDCLLK